MKKKVDVIGMPLFYGCDNPGVETGPKVMRDGGIIDIFKEAGLDVLDLGDVDILKATPDDKYKDDKHAKYLSYVVDASNKLAVKVDKSITSGKFPITLGGDHALGLGSVAGASKACDDLEKFGLVWFDAHADINTIETSPSGNIHGMPISGSSGIEVDERLRNVYFEGVKVKPENITIIGARDIDEGEVKIIKDYNIKVYSVKDFREEGLEKVMKEVVKHYEDKGITNLHFSYDIDGIDPEFIQGTGTRVTGGATMEEAKSVIEELIGSRLVKSMDLVEFNPAIEKGMTLEHCLDLAKCIASSIAKLK